MQERRRKGRREAKLACGAGDLEQGAHGLVVLGHDEAGARQVQENLCVVVVEEALRAVGVHVDGGARVALLAVDVGRVDPEIGEVAAALANLRAATTTRGHMRGAEEVRSGRASRRQTCVKISRAWAW